MVYSNLVSMDRLSRDEIHAIVNRASEFKRGAAPVIEEGATAINLFFENSTRTYTSFQMAEHKLGMKVLDFAPEHSSVTKGETLYDSVRTVDAIGADIAVIRHPQDNYYDELLAAGMGLSIINAGDGAGQHPSQSLLDIMTIVEEFGQIEGLNITIAGDILHSRVASSNAATLARLGANVTLSGPAEWMNPAFERFCTSAPMDEAVRDADVVMLLRVQHERFDAGPNFSAADYLARYGLSMERAARMKKGAIIMHPAPVNRGTEIDTHLVEAPNSRIFPQMGNGVWVRMAMLESVLLGKHAQTLELAEMVA